MTVKNLNMLVTEVGDDAEKKQFFQLSALNEVVSRLAHTGFFLSQQLLILTNPHVDELN
jgi:hypothetical protein